jgi:hypothetical protein
VPLRFVYFIWWPDGLRRNGEIGKNDVC